MKDKYLIGAVVGLLIAGILAGWFLIAKPPLSLVQTTTKENITAELSKLSYSKGEHVEFWIKNERESIVRLSNSAPWVIQKWEGLQWRSIYDPIANPVIVEVQPGEKTEWSWDPQDMEGHGVATGRYRVKLETMELTFSLVFEITEG